MVEVIDRLPAVPARRARPDEEIKQAIRKLDDAKFNDINRTGEEYQVAIEVLQALLGEKNDWSKLFEKEAQDESAGD